MHDTFEPTESLVVASSPGLAPRLLRVDTRTEDIEEYRANNGYRRLDSPDALLDQVQRSGLRGRGGAAFPFATKLRTVRDAHRLGRTTVVVANGEEGEPTSFKDKWLLRNRPHLILDGLRLAAEIVGAARAYVYVSDADSAHSVHAALDEVGESLGALGVSVATVAPSYVAGEETAAVRAINGGKALPTDKPPRPFESGVRGAPTAINNVETLANLPFVHRFGGDVFRNVGTAESPGTFLATVTGAHRPPGVYEIPHGTPITELLALHGVEPSNVRGALLGGYFAGMLNRHVVSASLDHEALRHLGSGLGCGAISLLTDECPVAVAASVMAYFDRENAGQCGSCFNGTAAMGAVLAGLRDGTADQADLDRLRRWSVMLRGRGACGTLDGAANLAASLLAHFANEITEHMQHRCPQCATDVYRAEAPFQVQAVMRS